MKIFFLTVLNTLLFFAAITNAQNGSVYSRYGIGDIDYGYSPKMMSIGELGVTQLDPTHIIVTNPASWSALNRTRVEVSLGYKGNIISNNTTDYFTSEAEFKGVTIGFPVSTEYGIGVVAGLLPFSRVSYKSVKNYLDDDVIPAHKVTFEGKGGISKIFLGSSVNLPLGFIGGATLDYYFGNIKYYSEIEFDDNSSYVNTTYENDHRITGFGSTVGLISPNLANEFAISTFSDFRIGFSLNYISGLNTDSLLTATSSTQLDTLKLENIKDTKIPLRLSGGISFVLNDVYHISLDYAHQAWTSYEFNGVGESVLRDASKYSVAFEYIPKKSMGMSSWEQIAWRGGLSYEQTQYKFQGTGIDQFSVFGGLTYPMGTDDSIDLGLQYSIRGTKDNNLIQEKFVKIYFGISLGELWFLRYEK